MSWRSASAVVLFAAVTAIESCALPRNALESEPPNPAPSSNPNSEIRTPKSSFESSVRPVLFTRCAPCHEPGGKMHASLPFDDAKTVSSNGEGIGRRLKGEDREALKRWLASLPASRPPTSR